MDAQEAQMRLALHASAIAMQCAVALSKTEILTDAAREPIADNLQKIAHILEALGTDPEAAAYHLAARAVRENKSKGSQG